jgi:glycosyltransferase A (GT-A) superfamily protein (DUF2064 family)
MRRSVVVVVAKAPVPGRVKTRLGRDVGMDRAADLAAAALLDTVSACVAAYGTARCHLALDGDLAEGRRGAELLSAVAGWTVHPQRGETFAERLVHAHTDVAAAAGQPVVQVGMDTPHLHPHVLAEVDSLLTDPDQAVLGPAHDGGWWLLGVGGPHLLRHLHEVPMSVAHTGARTRRALLRAGARVTEVVAMRDIDEVADAEHVAVVAPGSRFARAWS